MRTQHLILKFAAFYDTRKFITAFKKILPRVSILNHINPVQSLKSHFFRILLILSSHLSLRLSSTLFPQGFQTKILYAFLFSPTRATCPTHPILIYLIHRTISEEKYTPLTSSCISSPRVLALWWVQMSFSAPTTEHPQPVFLPQCERPGLQTK